MSSARQTHGWLGIGHMTTHGHLSMVLAARIGRSLADPVPTFLPAQVSAACLVLLLLAYMLKSEQ